MFQGIRQPLFPVLLSLIHISYGLYACTRNLPEQRLPLKARGLAVLGFLSAVCLLLVLLCGFTGHCQQHADLAVRNAVYEQLAAGSWPLVMSDGRHFIYYLRCV